jgi:hypothetical protein
MASKAKGRGKEGSHTNHSLKEDATTSSVVSAEPKDQPPLLQHTPREIWAEIFTIICLSHVVRFQPTENKHEEYYSSFISYDSLHPKHPSWILASVCRPWRNIMESLPNVWANIHIQTSFYHLSDKTLHNLFVSRLQLVITRSKSVPLNLKLDFRDFKRKSYYKTSLHRTLMSLLMAHYPRWRSFMVWDQVYHVLVTMLLYFQAKETLAPNFEMLEVFKIRFGRNQQPVPLNQAGISATFPKLRKLATAGRISPESILDFFPCGQLYDIEVGTDINITRLLPQFVNARKLSVLPLVDRMMGGSLDEALPIQHTSASLTVSHLTELSLTYWMVQHIPPDFQAPNLTVLKVETIIDKDTLQIATSFIHRSACKLLEFHVYHLECLPDQALLRTLLEAIPDVVNLHMGFAEENVVDSMIFLPRYLGIGDEQEIVANGFVTLLAGRKDKDKTFDLCPRLESLRIQIATRERGESSSLWGDDLFYDSESEEEEAFERNRSLDESITFHFDDFAAMIKERHLRSLDAVDAQRLGTAGQMKNVGLATNLRSNPAAQEALLSLEELEGLNVSFSLDNIDGSGRWKWERLTKWGSVD